MPDETPDKKRPLHLPAIFGGGNKDPEGAEEDAALQKREKAAIRRARDDRMRTREEARRMKKKAEELLKQSREAQKRESAARRHEDFLDAMQEELQIDPDRPITEIPDLPDGHEQVNLLEVEKGTAYVRMSYDPERSGYHYEVLEPGLEDVEKEAMEFIRDTLVRTLDGRHAVDPDQAADYLANAVQDAIIDHSLMVDPVGEARIRYYIIRDFLGYGPIDVMMQDPMLEDISCDGPQIPMYVFHRRHESMRTNVRFDSDLDLDSFVISLAQRSGKHISIARPLLDATLPDGSRLQATLSREVTTRGSSFTIRKFNETPLTMPQLIASGTLTAEMASYFWFLVENGFSLLFAGGTASGKTTTLNAVCQFIPPEKKVISLEDTREINMDHENWIAGLTRSGFGEHGAGEVDMYKLLEAALRQRPEYLLVGEVRGQEARTLFQAMATGHAVSSTMHADSVASAVHRLEHPPINVPRILMPIMDVMAIQSQARKDDRMVRRVSEVTEFTGIDPDTDDLLTNTVFLWHEEEDTHEFLGASRILEDYRRRNRISQKDMEAEFKRRVEVLQWMTDAGIHDILDTSKVIKDYYRHPDKVLATMKAGGDPPKADAAKTPVATRRPKSAGDEQGDGASDAAAKTEATKTAPKKETPKETKTTEDPDKETKKTPEKETKETKK